MSQAFTFTQLLEQAVTEPGLISSAYTAFHNYSFGNQLLAMFQCHARGIAPGPLATFQGWKARGRFVRKGEKALTLCQPVTIKRKAEDGDDATEDAVFTRFVYRPSWFVLSQTDGADFTPAAVASDWSKERALVALNITEIPFAMLDGNVQGYATKERQIAVSPVAAMPYKTLFHELGHIVLGHAAEGNLSDDERTPRSIREVEAEAVAMLCCAALELPGVEFSRGYIQHWHQSGEPIAERSAARIFRATDAILKAGQPVEVR